MNHIKLYEEFSEEEFGDLDTMMKDLGELGFEIPISMDVSIWVTTDFFLCSGFEIMDHIGTIKNPGVKILKSLSAPDFIKKDISEGCNFDVDIYVDSLGSEFKSIKDPVVIREIIDMCKNNDRTEYGWYTDYFFDIYKYLHDKTKNNSSCSPEKVLPSLYYNFQDKEGKWKERIETDWEECDQEDAWNDGPDNVLALQDGLYELTDNRVESLKKIGYDLDSRMPKDLLDYIDTSRKEYSINLNLKYADGKEKELSCEWTVGMGGTSMGIEDEIK